MSDDWEKKLADREREGRLERDEKMAMLAGLLADEGMWEIGAAALIDTVDGFWEEADRRWKLEKSEDFSNLPSSQFKPSLFNADVVAENTVPRVPPVENKLYSERDLENAFDAGYSYTYESVGMSIEEAWQKFRGTVGYEREK